MLRKFHRKIVLKERIKNYLGLHSRPQGRIIEALMKYIEKTFSLPYQNVPENTLFLDIETTGLKPETSHLYLFGCIVKVVYSIT